MAIAINIIGSYNDRDIKRAQADLVKLGDVAQGQSRSISDSMNALGDGMIAVGSKMTTHVTLPIVAAGTAMFMAFSEEEDAIARMNAALQATGGVAGVTSDHILGLASDLQKTTTFGDEATIAAAGLLLTFKNLTNGVGEGNDVFDRTLKASQDLAAFMGTDLDAAALQLAKALQDPTTGLTALRRSGVSFTEQQQDMIKSLVESGDMLGAQTMILSEVESQFGGTAETMAKTTSGQIKVAMNELGDGMEQMGAIIAPVISKVAAFFTDLGARFKALSPETKETVVRILAVAAAIGPMLVVGGKLIKVVTGITTVIRGMSLAIMANPVGLIVAAIAALIAILVVAYFKFDGFRKIVDDAWQGIQAAAKEAWEGFLKPIFEQLVAAFNDDILPALQGLASAFMEAWPGISNAISQAWEFIGPILAKIIEIYIFLYSIILPAFIKYYTFVFTAVVEILLFAWSIIKPILELIGWVFMNVIVPAALKLWEVMKVVWSGIVAAVSFAWGALRGAFEGIKSGISSVADFFGSAVGRITGVFSGIADTIRGAFSGAFQAVKDLWNSTLGGKGFRVPDIPGVPGRGTEFRFPTFNKGGIVPGIQGEPMLAMVHGGERILRPSEVGGRNDTSTGATYNITINGMVGADKRDILTFLARELPKVAANHSRSFG
jgi:phage-related protein